VIRVFLVDDQELVRAGFAMVVDAQPDMRVVGQADDGGEALTRLAATTARTSNPCSLGPASSVPSCRPTRSRMPISPCPCPSPPAFAPRPSSRTSNSTASSR